jgi:hypothetical protein
VLLRCRAAIAAEVEWRGWYRGWYVVALGADEGPTDARSPAGPSPNAARAERFQLIAEGLDSRPNSAGARSSGSIAGNQLGFEALAASNRFKCVRNVVEADACGDVGVAVE